MDVCAFYLSFYYIKLFLYHCFHCKNVRYHTDFDFKSLLVSGQLRHLKSNTNSSLSPQEGPFDPETNGSDQSVLPLAAPQWLHPKPNRERAIHAVPQR